MKIVYVANRGAFSSTFRATTSSSSPSPLNWHALVRCWDIFGPGFVLTALTIARVQQSLPRTIHALILVLFFAPPSFAEHQIVCSGTEAGGYAAFPDVCRLHNGELLCVFYSGYGHVSTPKAQWPKGGRIMAVRSPDNGKNWSKPVVIIDTDQDDRDPSVVCLKDGTLLLNWFTLQHNHVLVRLARSTDNGMTWSKPVKLALESPYAFACSTPARQLADGSLILGLYHEHGNVGFGATVKSYDGGKTWKDLALIGEKSGVYLDAETDVVPLKDDKLLAALRSSRVNMHYAISDDCGKTWGPVKSFGFKGHCPYFLRHSSGVILLAHRVPATSLHWTSDEGKTWHGPVGIDTVGGAYSSMVELPDGLVYCVYYEEGPGSSIRGVRLRVDKGGVEIVSRR
jgi:sialidase-1